MKIQQISFCQDSHLLDMAESHTVPKDMEAVQKTLPKTNAVEVSISDEGIKALQNKIHVFEDASDEIQFKEIKLENTNFLAFEHYTAMREIDSRNLKDKNYKLEDVMKSMMEAYETRYNQIIKEHENGGRQVSYEFIGERTLTLEEDLAGLDEAFERQVANLEGYITCQQTNKAFENRDSSWFFNRSKGPNRNDTKVEYLDEEYRNTAKTIMKMARKGFLDLREKSDYKEGASIGMLLDVLHSNVDFMTKTRKLFS